MRNLEFMGVIKKQAGYESHSENSWTDSWSNLSCEGANEKKPYVSTPPTIPPEWNLLQTNGTLTQTKC